MEIENSVKAIKDKLRKSGGSDTSIENKENVDPKSNLFDTLSFTDSLLNSTEIKALDRSSNTPRIPLSPIEINPTITLTGMS